MLFRKLYRSMPPELGLCVWELLPACVRVGLKVSKVLLKQLVDCVWLNVLKKSMLSIMRVWFGFRFDFTIFALSWFIEPS